MQDAFWIRGLRLEVSDSLGLGTCGFQGLAVFWGVVLGDFGPFFVA